MIFSALETSDRKSLLRNTPFQGLNSDHAGCQFLAQALPLLLQSWSLWQIWVVRNKYLLHCLLRPLLGQAETLQAGKTSE